MLAELRSAEERVGGAWGSYLGAHRSGAGAESLWEKLRDEMGKGVRGQIIMDFVFLSKSLRTVEGF